MVMYSPGRTSSYPDLPPSSGVRFHCLGGGDEVGNVGIVMEDPSGTRLLLDYGLAPTDPPRYPSEAPKVTDAVITHSHIDHLGMVPWIAAQHGTRLHGTSLTAAISEPMWHDCHKVSSIEGYPLAWDKRDIDSAVHAWTTHDWNTPWSHGPWSCSLHSAGHIPGAVMLEVDTGAHKVLFTGDFDTRDSPLVAGAVPRNVDILFLEGTYGGRSHPPQEEELDRFLARIDEVVKRGGTALVPAFANGRTQDVIMHLHAHRPHLDVHVNGMGKLIAQLQMEHPHLLRDPQSLQKAWSWVKRISSKSDRKRALAADVIVSTSGMLDGGPALWFLNRLRHDARNAVLLTGYQARGSGGRMLLDTGSIDIYGTRTKIDLDLDQFSFSTHAGHDELVAFAKATGAKHVVVYHSDPNHARPPLVAALEANGHTVHAPENGVPFVLE